MIHRLALSCVLAAAILALGVEFTFFTGGCAVCNGSVCFSRLGISVAEPGGMALAPGTWTFELVLDGGETLSAVCEIGEDSRSASCQEGTFVVNPIIRDDPQNPYTLYLMSIEGGDGLDGLPDVLDITIEHDGSVVHDSTYDIDYDRAEPERCDPDCFSADLDIVVER